MAQMITLGGVSPEQQIISHFLDQFNQNRQDRAQQDIQQQQVDQSGQYQQGQLENARALLEQKKAEYADTQLDADSKSVIAHIQALQDAADSTTDPNQKAALQAQGKTFIDSLDPRMQAKVKIIALDRVLNPERQEQLSTQQTMTGAAQGMATGAPTPLQANVFNERNFKQPISPQSLKDVQARQPEAAAPPPGQQPSPVTSFYRGPELGIEPTAAEKLTSRTQLEQTRMQQAGESEREQAKLKALGGGGNVQSMVDSLQRRQASLDDFAKKGSPLRAELIRSMPTGTIAPSNEKERGDLVAADNTAKLIYGRIQKIRQLAPVVDDSTNRAAIAGLLNASDTTFGNWMKGTIRNHLDPKTLDYVQEVRNLREDQFALRKYLGNSPVRSDKQVNIMLSQSVGADAGSSKDVNRMLDVFEPAVRQLVIGNQAAGAPYNPGSASAGDANAGGGGSADNPLGLAPPPGTQ